jgi:tRNA-modifying protein YgfZ
MTAAPAFQFSILPDRGVLAITGEDRVKYLQGLVSNDVRLAAPDRAIYAWFMTPQGKYLHDFLIFETGDALLLDVEAARRDDLLRRLKMYKLRSKITLEDQTDRYVVAAAFAGDGAGGAAAGFGLADAPRGAAFAVAGGWAASDPRTEKLGVRVILPRETAAATLAERGGAQADFADYDMLRLSLAVADGARDLIPEKSIALENGMDALGALSWDKGCYMGQELTARTKYRGLVKKQLISLSYQGEAPEAGTLVTLDGREAGELRSSRDGLALALLRLDELEAAKASPTAVLTAGEVRLSLPDSEQR